jgi:nucleoside-diphosphate-sugar epimerase
MMDSLRDSRILITGAAGFVGANLTRTLICNGAQVHALARPNTNLWRISEVLPWLTLHRADLRDLKELEKIMDDVQPEIIFHLAVHRAAGSPEERLATLESNVLGTVNLLEATASHSYRRLIHIGSSLEYGTKTEAMKETDMLDPVTFYGTTKAASTLLAQQFGRANNLPIVVLRLFSVYGYWENSTRLVPTAILKALHNQDLALTMPGYRRDFIFVEDVMEACLLAVHARSIAGEIINIGSGKQWSNEELVELVQLLSGSSLKIRVGEYPARASDTTHWVADNRKARRLLNWKPAHTLREGITKTIAWFRLHADIYSSWQIS